MRTGTIILVHNPVQAKFPFSSTLIWPVLRWITGSYYHHVALVWNVAGKILIVEALGKGVTVTNYDIWLKRAKRDITFFELECREEDLIQHIGKRYDRISFFVFCLLKILTKKWYGRPLDTSSDLLYCFEYAALVHNMPDWNQILPKEFICNLYMKKNEIEAYS
jgi:hypothetical protein